MPVRLVTGDILCDDAFALVIPINAVGVAGAGLAKQAAILYPLWNQDYQLACKRHNIRDEGDVWVWHRFLHEDGFPHLVVSLATKKHWRDSSTLGGLKCGLLALSNSSWMPAVPSLALPALGCGLGGLDWKKVRPLIKTAFANSPADVRLYAPQ